MIAQFIQDFFGVKGTGQGFDQHGGADAAERQPHHRLRRGEDIVPQPRFEIMFQLGQIEIGAGTARQQGPGIVEEIQAEIENGAGDAFAIDQHMGFIKVPAARPGDERRGFFVKAVVLALVLERNRAGGGIAQIDLALNHHVPSRRAGIFKTSHEALRARIERIDDHLAVTWPGDFDATIGQIVRGRAHLPEGIIAHRAGFAGEIDAVAGIPPALVLLTRLEQRAPGRFIHVVKLRDKGQRRIGQDGFIARRHGTGDLDTGGRKLGHAGLTFHSSVKRNGVSPR